MNPDPYTPPARRRPGWLIPVLVAAVVLVLAAGALGAWLFLSSRPINVAGEIIVNGYGSPYPGGMCVTRDGFTDIAQGAQVVIKDAAGKVLATTTLAGGTSLGGKCSFPFHASVPSGSDFYGVELGRRGVVQFTAEQLAGGVHLTIGG